MQCINLPLPLRQGLVLLLFGLITPTLQAQKTDIPLDDFTERTVVKEKMPLDYPPIRESDILWETRIWRIIDVREKMNLPFIYPDAPLFSILANGIVDGEIPAFSTIDDKFTTRLSKEEVLGQIQKKDTIVVWDLDSEEDRLVEVFNEINWENIKRYRVKESWFFDANTGTLKVRILGIAPLYNEVDDLGNFRFERPLFWVHYPSARDYLAQHKAYTHGGNTAANTTWEDLFEMRYFASCVIKEHNLYDRKIEEYLTGTDIAIEADKIDDGLFNREMDLWEN